MTRKKTAAGRDNSLLIGTSQFVLLYDISFLMFIWHAVKYENIYLQDYRSPQEARQGISEYLT